MKRVLFFAGISLVVFGCNHHETEKGERDSKGRSTAAIGTQTATAQTAVIDASIAAPPPVETDLVTLSWTGSITQSTGAAPGVGTACTLSTHATVKRHDALAVKCGDKTLYDEADTIDGATTARYALEENPVAGKVSVFSYELSARDVGSRTGRNQLNLETRKGTLSVFRETIPTFRVSIALAQKREERTGLPIYPDDVPPFAVVSTTNATLTSSKGPLPFAGKSCELRISPGARTYNCRVQLECAKKIVYGTGTGGYNACLLRGGQPISFSDLKPTPIDKDPALTFDLDTKTATFADEPAGGTPFTATFTLATP